MKASAGKMVVRAQAVGQDGAPVFLEQEERGWISGLLLDIAHVLRIDFSPSSQPISVHRS
jgi:hypothetical protein